MDLGRWVARSAEGGSLVRIAVSVPHRGFAAVFAALGIASGAYRLGLPSDAGQRSRFISSIAPGTPVRYREGDSAKVFECAQLVGVVDDRLTGMRIIKLARKKLTGKKTDYSRDVSRFRYIQPLAPGVNQPVHSRPICHAPDFVQSATGLDPIEHGFPTRLECVMIGTKDVLENELRLKLAAGSETGTLQDILRCGELLNAADGYRSRLLSAYSDPDSEMVGSPGGGIILDGPSAIVRHRHVASGHPWIALIDRTHRRAVDARDAILADRASSLEDVTIPIRCPPPGVEALSFADDLP